MWTTLRFVQQRGDSFLPAAVESLFPERLESVSGVEEELVPLGSQAARLHCFHLTQGAEQRSQTGDDHQGSTVV